MIAAATGVLQLTAAYSDSPIQKYRKYVQEHGAEPLPQPASLNAAVLPDSPAKDFTADVERDLTYNLRPLGKLPEPVSAVHTPSYTRGNYQMHSDPGLRLNVDLGPLLWIHADRGAPGNFGQILNETA